MSIIKPCPFCGGTKINLDLNCIPPIICQDCGGAMSPPGDDKIIVAWNRRQGGAIAAEPVGRIDAIERAICMERCAQMGEPACWQFDGVWPNPDCKDPDCRSLACAAESGIRLYETTDDQIAAQVLEMVRAGRSRIEAIRHIRTIRHLDLKDARDWFLAIIARACICSRCYEDCTNGSSGCEDYLCPHVDERATRSVVA